MTDEWTRAEKRKAQSEQAKAIMDFVSMLSDKIADLEKENVGLKERYKRLKERYDKVDIIGYDALKNLTKAKEIIRQLLNDYPIITTEVLDKLEQLRKEIEK